jgi:hypothetical protein
VSSRLKAASSTFSNFKKDLQMKTSIAKLALGLTLVSMSSLAMAGIANTRHNLGSTGTFNFSSATTEICVFCHTPHGADSSAAVPLWNKILGTPSSYNTYSSLGTTTMDADSAPIGSVSLACLSCHDGTQAMSVTINAPGTGSSGYVNFDGDGNLIAGTGGNGVDCIATTPGDCGGFNEFNLMSQVPGEMIYLSTDLRNDHPVSIQYAGTVGVGDVDFVAPSSTTVANGATVWYVDSNGTIGKQKDDLPLYTRADGVDLVGEPLVECATCHDPHTENTTFLRKVGANAGSATCLTCHVK